MGEVTLRHVQHLAAHRTRIQHGAFRYRSRAAHVCVAVPCAMMIIVIIGDDVDVRDPRIADVDSAEVTAAAAIPRHKRLTKSQRAPAIRRSAAESNTDSPAATTKPGHKCGSVHRTRIIRSRGPSPISAVRNPAAIVEGSKSPRLIIHPSPSPGIDPNPVSVAIGRPTNCDTSRPPDWTVLRYFSPGSIFIQIAGADHIGSNILSGTIFIFTLVAYDSPLIKSIQSWRRREAMRHGSAIGKPGLFFGFDPDRRAFAGSITFTFENCNCTCITFGLNFKAIFTRFLHSERHIGSVNLVNFAVVKFAQVETQCALMQLHLDGSIIEVGKCETGLAVHAKNAGAHAQLSA